MGDRSNINLVGNSTQGQNVGSGTDVYKGKSLGNTLQYKSLSSLDGTAIKITCDTDNIFLSGATGGGGSSFWSSGGTGLYPTNDEAINVDTVCSKTQSQCLYMGTAAYAKFSGTSVLTVDNGTSAMFIYANGTIGSFCAGDGVIVQGSQTTGGDKAGGVDLRGGVQFATGEGGDVCLCGGSASGDVDGSIYLDVIGDGSLYMCSLPAKSSETCGLWIDATGKLSTGFISGGSGGGFSATNNGLCDNGTTVGLGGTLANDTTIAMNNKDLFILDADNCGLVVSTTGATTCVILGDWDTFGNNFCIAEGSISGWMTSPVNGCYGKLCVSSWNTSIGHNDSGNTEIRCVCLDNTGVRINASDNGGNSSTLLLTDGQMTIQGTNSGGFSGITYSQDITANFKSRSLVTKAYVDGAGGSGYWSQSGSTIVYPTTGDCVKLYRAGRCMWLDGYGYVQSSHDLNLRPEARTSGTGYATTICGGVSNTAGGGGSVVLCGGFAYDTGAGGNIQLRPAIAPGGTGKIIINDLPAKTSETCALYIHANDCISYGTVAQKATFTGGTCEYSANNVCLGGALQAATTALCLNGATQTFMVCDTTAGMLIAICEHYSGAAVVIGKGSTSGDKLIIDSTESDTIKLGGIDQAAEAGLRIGGTARLQSYETIGACVGVTTGANPRSAYVVGSCDTAALGAGYAYICGGNSTSGGAGSVILRAGVGGSSNGAIFMCNLPNTNGACTVHIASNVVSYFVNASDCRLKCCLEPITGATSMLNAICGYSAEYNTISELSGTCQYVMLAQDVEQSLPLAVFDDVCANDETYKRIEYKQLIPVMWNIIKEQEARIAALENK